jgi:hypothetical protein
MFSRLRKSAQMSVEGMSRRRFMGRFGQVAAGVAGVVASLSLPSSAQAAIKCGGKVCPAGYNYCCKVPDPLAPHNFVRVCSTTPCK